jgi:hypothetical protein
LQVIVNEGTMHDTKQSIERRLIAVKSQRSSGELEDLALIIGTVLHNQSHMPMTTDHVTDGKSLTYALDKEVSKLFLELAIMCKAVICCKCLLSIYQLNFMMLCRSCLSIAKGPCRQIGQEKPQVASSRHWRWRK